jgi:hypothetical protein
VGCCHGLGESDRISASVAITRAKRGHSLYNSVTERAAQSSSPVGTLWAQGSVVSALMMMMVMMMMKVVVRERVGVGVAMLASVVSLSQPLGKK